jgi:hypothetical protein
VQGAEVIVGEKGKVTGMVAAQNVIVRGKVSVDLQYTPTNNFEALSDDLEVVTNHRFVGRCSSVRAEQPTVLVAPRCSGSS